MSYFLILCAIKNEKALPITLWSGVESLSRVWLLCDPMDCSPPGSSVHGIFQAIVLEWAAISFSKLHVVNRKMQPDFRDLRKWATWIRCLPIHFLCLTELWGRWEFDVFCSTLTFCPTGIIPRVCMVDICSTNVFWINLSGSLSIFTLVDIAFNVCLRPGHFLGWEFHYPSQNSA